MVKNIVVCFDGTDNQFGVAYSNVIRLVQSLYRKPGLQRLHYQPGIGTLPEPTFWNPLTYASAKVGNLADRAMAWRLERNVEDAYKYLMDFWETGARLFIFGFSRGAYTARVLAGMLHAMGLLPRGDYELIPYTMRLYKAIRDTHGSKEKKDEYMRLCNKFRWTFSRETDDPDRRFPIHFLGVWDTVSSVGWFWNPSTFQHTVHNPGIKTVRHAVSIDEKRIFYKQNLMNRMGGQDFRQHWFAGDHSDIGGGHSESEGGLWRVTFHWMIEAAQAAELYIDPARMDEVLNESQVPGRTWTEPIHDLLKGKWWLAEAFGRRYFPKGTPTDQEQKRSRYIRNQQSIDRSVLLRIRETDYRPPNFSPRFIDRIKRLNPVPESLAFEW